MNITINLNDIPVMDFSLANYDSDLDNVNSLLSDICESIENSGGGVFTVRGFGDNEWPVDIRTDLCVLLEQLPNAIHIVKNNLKSFDIDFYEQGIERYINFERKGDGYIAKCSSLLLSWKPAKDSEYIPQKELLNMLLDIQNEFTRFVAKLSPQLLAHPWLEDWILCKSNSE